MKKYSIREYGPCPTCGKMFESRGPKVFCSMKCYTSSETFQNMMRQRNIDQRTGENVKCRECGKEFYMKKYRKEKGFYCSTVCYRKYMAKRFDRWIASPETIALPQNYDEFLTSHELPCLVDGCGWRGNFLSMHMNFAHGVRARDFKKMAGFNLQSGIISLPLYELMCARPHIKEATFKGGAEARANMQSKSDYRSLEGKEHTRKTFIINRATTPARIIKCLECGNDATVFFGDHAKKFCSSTCRANYYNTHDKERISKQLPCAVCSTVFDINANQYRRSKKGYPVVCSLSCRQKLNAPKGVGSHSTWATVVRKDMRMRGVL